MIRTNEKKWGKYGRAISSGKTEEEAALNLQMILAEFGCAVSGPPLEEGEDYFIVSTVSVVKATDDCWKIVIDRRTEEGEEKPPIAARYIKGVFTPKKEYSTLEEAVRDSFYILREGEVLLCGRNAVECDFSGAHGIAIVSDLWGGNKKREVFAGAFSDLAKRVTDLLDMEELYGCSPQEWPKICEYIPSCPEGCYMGTFDHLSCPYFVGEKQEEMIAAARKAAAASKK